MHVWFTYSAFCYAVSIKSMCDCILQSFESQHAELKAAMMSLEKECDSKQVEINEVNKSLTKVW